MAKAAHIGIPIASPTVNGNGGSDTMHLVPGIPKPAEQLEDGTPQFVTVNGHALNNPTREGFLMTRLNSKVETTKGTIALIALIPAFAAVVITLAISMMGWAREDGAVKRDVQELREDVKGIQRQMEEMSKAQIEERIQREKQQAFNTGLNAAGGK